MNQNNPIVQANILPPPVAPNYPACVMPSPQAERKASVRLAGLRALGALIGRNKPVSRQPERILLVRPDHIGDMLITTPAISLLRAALPNAHLTMLAGPWSKVVLDGNPDLDEIITCEFPGFTRGEKQGGLLGPYRYALQVAAQLRGNYDAALILRDDHWWGALLCALAGIPFRAGYDLPECKPFLTHALPSARTYTLHQAERSLRLARACAARWGAAPDRLKRWYPAQFYYSAEDEIWAKNWIKDQAAQHGVSPDRPLVLIHPGAGAEIKLWEPEKWAQVADKLQERYGAQIIITGTPGEAAHAQAIAQNMRHAPWLAIGGTTLRQLAALLRECTVALGTDNGTMHLAATLDVPSLRMYGPIDPIAFGPYTNHPERHRWIRTSWGCAPCGRLNYTPEEMQGHDCVRSIPAALVLRQADHLFKVES